MSIDGIHERRLIITGTDDTPSQIYHSQVTERADLRTTQEEADIIIIQQLFTAVLDGAKVVKVICDDTDVFALLSHHQQLHNLKATILMEETHHDRDIIDINETIASSQENVISSILPMHALTGCDTEPKLFRIGKKTAINVLKKQRFEFQHLGNIDSDVNDVMAEATSFIGACYGVNDAVDMSEVRYAMWRKKTEGGKLTSAPNLAGIPPTREVFEQNVLRAHYQAIIWNHALIPPALDPCKYGWYKDTVNHLLQPVMIPAGCNVVPPQVLKIFNCNCSSAEPCSSGNCSCALNKLSCNFDKSCGRR